jgi:hypothetical protein
VQGGVGEAGRMELFDHLLTVLRGQLFEFFRQVRSSVGVFFMSLSFWWMS